MTPTESSPAERPSVITRDPLNSLFTPRCIAVIGATDKPGSVGQAVLKNLQLFDGRVFPINPKRKTVGGIEAFPSIRAVPERVDLVVIATPAPTVPGLIRECAEAGVPAAIIISAGFRETGAVGVALERECLLEARKSNMRLLGPNCLGLIMPHHQLNASFADGIAQPGSVAFLSQSGALCSAVLDWSFRENVGFSAFVSVGSMLDVGWGDLITYFGDDPNTKSIVCYMESVGDARAFLSAAREVALTKPIIILKVGHSEAGARAAASHTGALTGSDAVLDAAFQRAGVLRVNTIAELFNLASLLSKQPRPRGPRLAIVTNAGGPSALATDALVANRAQLAELQPATLAGLEQFLPAHWSHGNPIDVLGDADAAKYAQAIDLALKDPGTDGVLVILTPQAMTDATGTAEAIRALAKENNKPILASWMGGGGVATGKAILSSANIPTFDYPDTAARAFALMWRYSENVRALYETPALDTLMHAPSEAQSGSRSQSRQKLSDAIITSVHESGRTLLTEVESKQLLSYYGIPTIETRIADTAADAVKLAAELGYPVVLKLYSKTITHKTDVGGVQLDLNNEADVLAAWKSIRSTVGERAGLEHFLGVTVQPMIPRHGYELILGSSVDPQFGPVLLFGAGGQLVEVIQDRSLGLPPLNATLARRMIEHTKVLTALRGIRGRKGLDLAALEQLIVRFSQLVAENRWIAEIDVNPLLVSTERMIALDARVVLHPPTTLEADLPRLAIRPYPTQYVSQHKLPGNEEVTVRPIRPEDEPTMLKFHQTLSDRSVYLRYFEPLKLDERIAHERLSRVCFIDYDRDMVLVAEHQAPGETQATIIGVGRLNKLHGTPDAEFALLISDRWQGRKLGQLLLQQLVQIGRDESLQRISAIMLGDNREMQHVARKCGFQVERMVFEGQSRAELKL